MNRFVYQENEIKEIETENLICKNCIFRNNQKAGICEMFPDEKPIIVFNGKCTLRKTE